MLHRILALTRKDIRLLLTDKQALFWIFFFPLMYSLLFGFMFSTGSSGTGKITLAVVDEDGTDGSRKFVEKLQKSASLDVRQTRKDGTPLTKELAQDSVRKGDYTGFLIVPKGYGKTVEEFWKPAPPLEFGIDPSRKAEEGMLEGILMEQIFSGMQETFADPAKAKAQAQKALADLDKDQTMAPALKASLKQMLAAMDTFMGQAKPQDMDRSPFAAKDRLKKVPVAVQEGQMPKSSFEVTFPSAIVWGMFGCIITFAISIVQERTKGTLIRLRMSPLTQMEILAGKGLACLIVCLVVATVLQMLGRLIFGVRIESAVGLLLALVSVAVCYTGLMMALATVGKTERAVSGSANGIFMPLAMLGGAMIPLFVMPSWMQTVSNVSPVKWSILALEGAIWRGFTLSEMLLPCGILLAIGAVFFVLGVRLLSRQEV
jgi:ABC-2 type transport system permease protein